MCPTASDRRAGNVFPHSPSQAMRMQVCKLVRDLAASQQLHHPHVPSTPPSGSRPSIVVPHAIRICRKGHGLYTTMAQHMQAALRTTYQAQPTKHNPPGTTTMVVLQGTDRREHMQHGDHTEAQCIQCVRLWRLRT